MANVGRPKNFENMSHEERVEYWEKKRECEGRDRQVRIDGLTQEQRDAVSDAYKALSAAMMSLHECQDLWMSDIKKMDDSMWSIRREFNLGDNDG
jgi:hypothetical protein